MQAAIISSEFEAFDSLQEEMATQPERIASLETHRLWHWIVLSAVAVGGFSWLGWVSVTLVGVRGDMQAVKQRLKDGGLGDIVSQLQNPSSPQELEADLSTMIARIQTARVQGRKPDPDKTQALSTAMTKVVQQNPQLPEAWAATAELVSFKSLTSSPNSLSLPPCNIAGAQPESRQVQTSHRGQLWVFGYFFSNCSLKVEDVPPLLISAEDWPKNGPRIGGNGKIGVPVHLLDGEVIYNGGPIQHDAGFVFENCVFQLKTVGIPTEPMRAILDEALKDEKLIDTSSANPFTSATS